MTAARVESSALGPRRSRRWVVLTGYSSSATVTTEAGRVLLGASTNLTALTPAAAVELGDALRVAGGAPRAAVAPLRADPRLRPDPRPLSPTELRSMATQLDRLAAVLDEQAR